MTGVKNLRETLKNTFVMCYSSTFLNDNLKIAVSSKLTFFNKLYFLEVRL